MSSTYLFLLGFSSPPGLLKDFSKLGRVPIIKIRYAPDHFKISKLFPLQVALIFQCPPFYLEGKYTLWCLHCLVRCNRKNIATSFHSFCFLRTILSLLFLQKLARKWQFVVSMLECPAGKKYCRLLLLLQLSNTPFLDKSLSKSKPFVHFSPGFNCKRKKVGQLSGNLCHQGGGGPTPNGKIHFKFLFPLYRWQSKFWTNLLTLPGY